MRKTAADLILLAGTGADLIIDASKIPTAEIIQIISSIGLKGAHITISNSNSKPTADLILMTRNYPKNITFDLRENDDSNDLKFCQQAPCRRKNEPLERARASCAM